MSEILIDIMSEIGFETGLSDEIVQQGHIKKVKAGSIIASPEDIHEWMPFVMTGVLKVTRQDEEGAEAFLYYLEGGETCVMSITYCFEGKQGAFKVTAEEDSELWMIPMKILDQWIVKYVSFRKFVFGSYQLRFDELLRTIDSLAFSRLDERLYKFLLDTQQVTGSFQIRKTHGQIARELNTSRVVVSRLLKQLENEGKVEQQRNLIEIL